MAVDMKMEIQGDEPEAVVLLGVRDAQKESPVTSTADFVDEIEDIIGNTDKLFIRESSQGIPDVLSNFDVDQVYEILDGKGERAFLMGRCRSKDPKKTTFVLMTSGGHGLLHFVKKGFLNKDCEIEGAGILSFTLVKHLHGGYLLKDKWKNLLKISPSWVEFFPCILYSSNKTATVEFQNLDGTPSGTLTYKKWMNLGFDDRTLCVHFIPNLDRKAKYMVFAASLMPYSSYFSDSGSRLERSIILTVLYTFLILLLVVVTITLVHIL